MGDTFKHALSAVTEALNSPPSPDNIEMETVVQLLGSMDKLRVMLEPPNLAIIKLCTAPYALSCIRVAQGMGIFNAFFHADDPKEMTLNDLNAKTKGDKELLSRIMRHLNACDIFTQVDSDRYRPSALALQLADDSPVGACVKHFYLNMRATSFLNEYFEERGYVNPSDAYDAPFQYAHGTKEHFFSWLSHHPADQEAFNSVMTMNRQVGESEWFEIFPVEERLQVSTDRTLIVDIGGGVGHDMLTFNQKFPHLPGKLVVQDIPSVIGDIKSPLPEGIDAMTYDMFDPQPVKGAKAYYLRTVLHDWPDKQALEALARIREAMAEDSILLLNEFSIPESDVSRISAAIDQDMMEAFSSLDRTEPQWISLLERGGFEVVKVWRFEFNATMGKALYEAVPRGV
ncbi:hypothetical protein FE257_001789 [Aspergillus nanangensis]|uniref:O-methyltransferase C-terminal domain-containing protein n=1 Tax=Aspergillus nanangensis TaxID=2582783 RepID=A0AAD4CDC1_ASPNN|nr:hypothetical protein FE257_001789 [Aspergillus nanangensis]